MMVLPSRDEVESFALPGTEHKNATGLLPFNEEHRSLGINGGGFNFVESLSGLN